MHLGVQETNPSQNGRKIVYGVRGAFSSQEKYTMFKENN